MSRPVAAQPKDSSQDLSGEKNECGADRAP